MTLPLSIRTGAFWQGFAALLLAFGVAQLLLQVDVVMLGQRAPGSPGAYVMLTRLVLIDLVVTMAYGAVASVTIAHAAREGDASLAIRRAMGLAGLIGVLLLGAGWIAYPLLAPWVAGGDATLVRMLELAIPWFVVGAPFRMLNACAAFALHATQRGAWVVRWKLCEVALKVVMNVVFLDLWEAGFAGCFMASLLVHAVSTCWVLWHLRRQTGGLPAFPPLGWSRKQVVESAWEAKRILALQLLGLLTISLFASPMISTVTTARLDAFAAGLALAMFVFSPLAAFLRFLAIRFSGRSAADLFVLMRELLFYGVPAAVIAGLLLSWGQHWLGRAVYAQEGAWWSVFVWSLAFSLPVRVAGTVLRAGLQSRGGFNEVAKTDILLGWGLGLPVIAVGLGLDLPILAYAFLWLPEVAVVAWLALRYRATSTAGDSPVAAVENS
ncbi:MATE family efflux transporter [Comamonas composti]|uniref:multi antimicrobial extrusion protein MatE n=1 Tax=Comamonas composti TaxID=408558 RepID=UPI0012EC4C15|nr:multi antimicrobial extrusion protein MatE [Comamonas composti]